MANLDVSLLPTTLFLLLLLPYSEPFKLELARRSPPPTPRHSISENRIRPPLTHARAHALYTAGISIGTPRKSYHLILDTASDMTWWQCKGCRPRFKQTPPLFDPSGSSTSSAVPCTSPLRGEFPCVEGKCFYSITHGGGATSKGFLYSDTLWLPNEHGRLDSVEGFAFGCNNETRGLAGAFGGEVVGELGMGRGPLSLVSQLRELIGNRFSYCLHKGSTAGYLRFGEDAVMAEEGAAMAALEEGSAYYSLKLLNISFGASLVELPAVSDGGYRVILATGLPSSDFPTLVYRSVVAAVGTYMAEKGHEGVHIPAVAALHCWKAEEVAGLPEMTLHVEGGSLRVRAGNLFRPVMTAFGGAACLTVTAGQGRGGQYLLLGAKQQQDTRFLLDLERNVVQFASADCST